MGGASGPKIPTNSLSVLIDAANSLSYSGSGIIINDLISGGFGATFWSGSGYSSANLGTFAMSGSNAIRFEDSTTFRPTNLTVSAWCKFNAFDAFDTVVAKAQTAAPWGPPYVSYMIRVENGTNVNYALGDASYRSSNYNVTLALNTYYHFAMTYDGANVRGFLNGTNVITTPLVITIAYAALPILVSGSYGASPFGETTNGNVTMFGFYNRALSINEITQIYNNTKGRFGL